MQTLYAVIALAVFGILSLTAHRHSQKVDSRIAESETETVALGVAAGVLNQAASLPFDGVGEVTDVSELTPQAGFGGAATLDAAADLDDLDGVADVVTVEVAGRSLGYEVTVSVQYLEKAGGTYAPSATPTAFKELRAQVTGPQGRPYVLTRVYGCLFLAEAR